jgi:hypothetical protein
MSQVERIGVSVDKKLSLPSQRRVWLPFAVLTERGVLSLTIDWQILFFTEIVVATGAAMV